ncbi:molybdenum cofactor biosynthesis protein MogA [Citrobacter freundii]|nr:molybdenum cofactor biosynthesis protein MogA [Citrobacter freundii]
MNTLRIGLVSISDRASSGVYQDKGIPALEEWLASALTTPFELQTRLIPDEQAIIEQTLCELVDEMSCHLVLTTGGTGPARRDVTPDATLAVADRQMPGFGEQMRQISLHFVPTAILSPPGWCDSQTGVDPESAWAAEIDQRNAGRRERCRR